MCFAVYLYRKSCRVAIEINYEPFDDLLTPEMKSSQLTSAKPIPR